MKQHELNIELGHSFIFYAQSNNKALPGCDYSKYRAQYCNKSVLVCWCVLFKMAIQWQIFNQQNQETYSTLHADQKT